MQQRKLKYTLYSVTFVCVCVKPANHTCECGKHTDTHRRMPRWRHDVLHEHLCHDGMRQCFVLFCFICAAMQTEVRAVCVCVCVYVCMCVYTYTCMYIYIYTYMYVCICMYLYVYMYVYVHICEYVCIYIQQCKLRYVASISDKGASGRNSQKYARCSIYWTNRTE